MPSKRKRPTAAQLVAFESAVRKQRKGCWLWEGKINLFGFGVYTGGSAHRFAYEAWRGEVPEGRVVHHTCENRACVNPEHLATLPMKTYIATKTDAGLYNAEKTHCPAGHPYTPENVYNAADGFRKCRVCHAEWRGRRKGLSSWQVAELKDIDRIEAFWAKVDRRGRGDCWLWTGALFADGTAKFQHDRATRFAYQLLVDRLKPKESLHRLCANASCVNPEHCELRKAKKAAGLGAPKRPD